MLRTIRAKTARTGAEPGGERMDMKNCNPWLKFWTRFDLSIHGKGGESRGAQRLCNSRLGAIATAATALLTMTIWKAPAAMPDLIINSNAVNPRIVVQTFSSTDCDVVEGCITAGTHTLLQFNTESWNIGDADLVVGNPTNNPLFYFSPCHGHFHFDNFATYNLLDQSGRVLVRGHKQAFCMEDVLRWNPNANPNRIYDCSYQGIQKGWADVYAAGLPCQWIDITGVPPGNYLMQLIINPDNLLPESNTNNNVTYYPVTIPGQCQPPANDNFANAQALSPNVPQSVLTYNYCATTEPGEPWIYNQPGGASIWFSWTPAVSQPVTLTTVGSDFDTVLAVYVGSGISTMSQVAANDDIVPGVVTQSLVTFNAVQGTKYMVTVDGYQGAVGRVQLNFNPPPNDFFTNAQVLSGVSGTVMGYNIGASKEAGEPAHDAIVGGHSVWYRWTAPGNGLEVFDTIGSDFDTVVAVYTGTSVGALTPVVADNDSGGNKTSRASFNAISGTTYRIAVDGFTSTNVATAAGHIVLHWSQPSHLSINLAVSPLQLNVTGGPGSYAVQYSTNLLQWQTLTNFTMSGSSFQCRDGSERKKVFYRAVLLSSP